jgi:hypothetical protein
MSDLIDEIKSNLLNLVDKLDTFRSYAEDTSGPFTTGQAIELNHCSNIGSLITRFADGILEWRGHQVDGRNFDLAVLRQTIIDDQGNLRPDFGGTKQVLAWLKGDHERGRPYTRKMVTVRSECRTDVENAERYERFLDAEIAALTLGSVNKDDAPWYSSDEDTFKSATLMNARSILREQYLATAPQPAPRKAARKLRAVAPVEKSAGAFEAPSDGWSDDYGAAKKSASPPPPAVPCAETDDSANNKKTQI